MGVVGVIQDRIPGAKELAIALTGQMMGQRRWNGSAVAEEPIVAMTILAAGRKRTWVKAAQPESKISMSLQLSSYDDGHRDVQVAAEVGGDFVYSRSLLAAREQTFRVEPGSCRTGGPTLLAVIEGAPRIEIYAFFIARSDVKFGRNRLWHLRPTLAEAVEEPLRSVLTRGRTGEM